MRLFEFTFDPSRLAPWASRCSIVGVVALVLFGPVEQVCANKMATGEAIYAKHCLSCHGEGGQGGTEDYQDKLVGDASIGELTEIIADTMPEEDPDLCVGEDAKAVAEFIHESFFSEAAQLRRRRPTRQLSRLTATQIQQSLADLYQHFFSSPSRVEKRGLSASYFNSGRWDKKQLKLERIDPVLDFDFARADPVEGVEAKQFYINWTGAVQIEHSGRYEFVVESTCSMKMRFGHHDHVLIDNHVQSAGKTEFRRTMNLIGGRQYPIVIDFTQRERKTELPPAKFALRWIPPGGTETVIPSENLLPSTSPDTFALQTKLPPDDRSYGYDRGTRVDRQWNDAVTAAALEFGAVAGKELWPRYSQRHRKDPKENRVRLRGFLKELADIAFRGPIDAETQKTYIDDQLDASDDDQIAIARCCLLIITSPRFLYPTLDRAAPTSQRVASRLALTLYDSLPADTRLLKQISENRLEIGQKNAVERIRQTAWQMSDDPRLHGKMLEMFFDWLDVDPAAEIVKDTARFQGFDGPLVQDLRRSLTQMLDDIFWSESSDYRELFLRDWNWTNARLESFYGEGFAPQESAESNRLVESVTNEGQSFGVLTHPLVMSHLSYYQTTSPIHRGVFLIRRMLGRTLRPPNEAFTPFDADLHPGLTTRQRIELQTGDAKCQVCHSKINPLGFPLENYDAVGRFRVKENGKPIDASGSYVTRGGKSVQFSSPSELATFLAEDDEAHRAFVEKVFEHFVKQPIAAYGDDVTEKLVSKFRESGFHMRRLVVEIAVVAATQSLPQENSDEST